MFGIFGGTSPKNEGTTNGAQDKEAYYEHLLAEKDEEINDLHARIEALHGALNKDDHMDMDDLHHAMAEKNRVLEEQFTKIDELRHENEMLTKRLIELAPDHASVLPQPMVTASPEATDASIPSPEAVQAAPVGSDEVPAAVQPTDGSAEQPVETPTSAAETSVVTNDEPQSSSQVSDQAVTPDASPKEAELLHQQAHLTAQLQQSHAYSQQVYEALMQSHQQQALQQEELAKGRAENEELQRRLADALAHAAAAQQSTVGEQGPAAGEGEPAAQSPPELVPAAPAAQQHAEVPGSAEASSADELEAAREEARRANQELQEARTEGARLQEALRQAEIQLSASRDRMVQVGVAQASVEPDEAVSSAEPPQGTEVPSAPIDAPLPDEQSHVEAATSAALPHDNEVVVSTEPLEDTELPSASFDVDAMQSELSRLQDALHVSQEQLSFANTSGEESKKAADEARLEAAKLQEALKQAEEQIHELRSQKEVSLHSDAATLQPSTPEDVPEGQGNGDAGWDFDMSEAKTDEQLEPASAPVLGDTGSADPAEHSPDPAARVAELEQALKVSEEHAQRLQQAAEDIDAQIKDLGDARREAAAAKEALKNSEEQLSSARAEISRLEAAVSETSPLEKPPEEGAAPSDAEGAGGWDVDMDADASAELPSAVNDTDVHEQGQLTEAVQTSAESVEQELAEVRSENAGKDAALRAMEEELNAARSEIAKLQENLAQKAAGDVPLQEKIEDTVSSQPAGGQDDGWDVDMEEEHAHASALGAEPSATSAANAESVLEIEQKVAEKEKALAEALSECAHAKEALKTSEEQLSSARAEIARLEAERQAAGEAEAVGAAGVTSNAEGEDGWNLDVKDDASEAQAATESDVALAEARSECAKMQEALRVSDEQLHSAREEIAKLEAEKRAVSEALGSVGAVTGAAAGDDGWDVDDEEHSSATRSDSEHETAFAESRAESANLQEALKLAQEQLTTARAEIAKLEAERQASSEAQNQDVGASNAGAAEGDDGWDFDVEGNAPAPHTAVENEKALAEAHSECAKVQEALRLSEEQLSSARAEIARLEEEKRAVVDPQHVNAGGVTNAPEGDDGWNLDVEEHAPQMQAAAESEKALAEVQEALRVAEEQLSGARAEIARLEAEKQSTSEAQNAGEGDDGWDLDVEGHAPQAQAAAESEKALAEARSERAEVQEALRVAEEQLSGARAEIARLEAEKQSTSDALNAGVTNAASGDDDGWDFDVEGGHAPAAQETQQKPAEAEKALAEVQEALRLSEEQLSSARAEIVRLDAERQAAIAAHTEAAAGGTSAAAPGDDDGWDFDAEAHPQEAQQTDAMGEQALAAARSECENVREALRLAEEQLSTARTEIARLEAEKHASVEAQDAHMAGDDGWDLDVQGHASEPQAATEKDVALDEARSECAKVQEELRLSAEQLHSAREEIARLEAEKHAVIEAQSAAAAVTGAAAGDDGWDFDDEGRATSTRPDSEHEKALADSRAECANVQEALKLAEEQLTNARAEIAKLEAERQSSTEVQNQDAGAGDAHVAEGDDGWDFDVEGKASAPPTAPDSEKALAEVQEALRLSEEKLSSARAEIARLEEEKHAISAAQTANGVQVSNAPEGDEGWDFDVEDHAPQAQAAAESEKALAEARSECVQVQEALRLAEEQLSGARAEIARLEAEKQATSEAQNAGEGDDGWDIDVEGHAPQAQAAAAAAESEKALAEARSECVQVQEALRLAEEQLSGARAEIARLEAEKQATSQAQNVGAMTAASGDDDGWDFDVEGHDSATQETERKAAESEKALTEVQEALKLSEEQLNNARAEIAQLRAEKQATTEQHGVTSAAAGLGSGEDDGWDFDVEESPQDKQHTHAMSEQALAEARSECANVREALRLAEEQLSSARTEIARLEADKQATSAAQNAPVAGDDDDGWDFDVEEHAPAAQDAQQKTVESDKALAETQEALKLAEEQLRSARAEISRLEAEKQAASAAQNVGSTGDDDGWDFDDEGHAPAVHETHDRAESEKALAEARSECASVKEALKLAEEQLGGARAEISRLEAEKEATSAAVNVAGAAAGDDDDGWDFDVEGHAPAIQADTQQQAAEKELAEVRAALKLSEEQLSSARAEIGRLEAEKKTTSEAHVVTDDDGWDFDVEEHAPAAQDPLQKATQNDAALAEAHAACANVQEALRLSEEQLSSARERIAQLETEKAAASDAHAGAAGLGSIPAGDDDGWDFDVEGHAPAVQESEQAAAAHKALAEARSECADVRNELQLARHEIARLEAEKKASSEAQNLAAAAEIPDAGFDDDGWDFDLSDDKKHDAPLQAVPAPGDTGSAEVCEDAAAQIRRVAELEQKLKASEEHAQGLQHEIVRLQAAHAAQDGTASGAKEKNTIDDPWDIDLDDDVLADPAPAAAEKEACDSAIEDARREAQEARQSAAESAKALAEARSEATGVENKLRAAEEQLSSTRAEVSRLEEELKRKASSQSLPEDSSAAPVAIGDEDGWDFDFEEHAGTAATAPVSAGSTNNYEDVQQKVMEGEKALAEARSECASVQKALKLAEEQLSSARTEIARLEADKAVTGQQRDSGAGAAGGGLFGGALSHLKKAEPSPAPADGGFLGGLMGGLSHLRQPEKPAPSGDPDGWGDLDFDNEPAAAVTAPAAGSAENSSKAAAALEEARWATEALQEARQRLSQEEDNCAEARSEVARLQKALHDAEATTGQLQGDIERLQTEYKALSTASAAHALPGTGPSDANTEGDAWDVDFGDLDTDAGTKPKGDEAGMTALRKQTQELRAELAVATGRAALAEDQIKAERAVHSESATNALRAEVASISEALVQERQERQAEEAHLRQLLRQAQEDLRQQTVAAQASSAGSPSDMTHLLGQVEALRLQRDQARSIAQCIARQTSTLADEIYRLRTGSGTEMPDSAQRTATRSAHPGGVSLNSASGGGSSGSQPPHTPEQRAVPQRSVTASPDGEPECTLRPAATSTTAASRAQTASQSLQGPESQALRPPDEVTSGWDVFDPDDQIENTIPTGPPTQPLAEPVTGPNNGWDDDMDGLLNGLDPFPASGPDSSAAPPELSPAARVESTAQRGTAAPASGGSAAISDLDFDSLLGGMEDQWDLT